MTLNIYIDKENPPKIIEIFVILFSTFSSFLEVDYVRYSLYIRIR